MRIPRRNNLEIRYPGEYSAVNDAPAPQLSDRDVLANAVISPLDLSAIHPDAHIERRGQANSAAFEITGHISLPDLDITEIRGTVRWT